MKRLIIAAASVTLITSAALAASDTGTIIHIDPNSDAITLDDGKTFTLAEGTEAESVKNRSEGEGDLRHEGRQNGCVQNRRYEIVGPSLAARAGLDAPQPDSPTQTPALSISLAR